MTLPARVLTLKGGTLSVSVVDDDAPAQPRVVWTLCPASPGRALGGYSVGEVRFSYIFGGFPLHRGTAIALITAQQEVAEIRGHSLYKATGFEIVHVPDYIGPETLLTKEQQDYDNYVLKCLRSYVRTENLYFCADLDLSKQILPQLHNEMENRAGERYHINYAGSKWLATMMGLETFTVPCITGYIGVGTAYESGKDSLHMLLISRKAVAGDGRRLLRRGAGWFDPTGGKDGCANFYECEFILYNTNSKTPCQKPTDETSTEYGEKELTEESLIILRGSAPVVFDQHPNLRLTPPVHVADDERCKEAFAAHIETLENIYDRVCCVNLLRTKPEGADLEKFSISRKNEFTISDVYKQLCEEYIEYNNPALNKAVITTLPEGAQDVPTDAIGKLNYVGFDFHTRCKRSFIKSGNTRNSGGVEYSDLFKLESGLTVLLSEFGHNKYTKEGCQLTQTGVLRINCLDSLDRTNVVQAIATKCALTKFSIDGLQTDNISHTVYEMIRLQGDSLSKSYSGTSALHAGLLSKNNSNSGLSQVIKDGTLSLIRYIMNNFADYYRQDTNNIATGYYKILKPSNIDGSNSNNGNRVQFSYMLGRDEATKIPRTANPGRKLITVSFVATLSIVILSKIARNIS